MLCLVVAVRACDAAYLQSEHVTTHAGFNVTACDRRGTGLSHKPNSMNYLLLLPGLPQECVDMLRNVPTKLLIVLLTRTVSWLQRSHINKC